MRAITLSVLLASSATAATLPSGWREPGAEELQTPGSTWRQADGEGYRVIRGDFDGDGRQDEARLLVSTRSPRYGVFVLLGGKTAGQLSDGPLQDLRELGLTLIPSGPQATACGKGYGHGCQPGQAASIDLAHPGIGVFVNEGASGVYYWPASATEFSHEWLSD